MADYHAEVSFRWFLMKLEQGDACCAVSKL